MPTDLPLDSILAELGFASAEAQTAARAALEAAGLTNPRKSRISDEKLPRVRECLARAFVRACAQSACVAALRRERPGTTLVTVDDAARCEHCGGSANQAAARRFAAACAAHAVRSVLIVGGSPSTRQELARLFAAGPAFQLVDGTGSRRSQEARDDVKRADLALIWASTELNHKVSLPYTQLGPPLSHRILAVNRRGIAALLDAASDHLETGGRVRG